MTSILSAKKSSWVTREDDRFESLYLRQKFQCHETECLKFCGSSGPGLRGAALLCGDREVAVAGPSGGGVLLDESICILRWESGGLCGSGQQ